MSAAAVARRRDPELDVLVLERGPYTSYSACGIPYLIAGLVEGPDQLIARSPDEYRQAGIDVRTLCEVEEIDIGARALTYRDHDARTERREGFDELVYATGAIAVAPPVPGAELVEPVRTIDAAERLLARLERSDDRHAVVIGAGYLGLEMAEALVLRGLDVTLVDRDRQVMPPLDADMAAHVQAAAEGAGIRVLLSTELAGDPRRPRRPPRRRQHVGRRAARRPRRALHRRAARHGARRRGRPPLGATGGVRVDDHQRCLGHDGVYAAGDCAESRHRLLPEPVNVQLGTHANKQGRVAGTNATGGDVAFPGLIGTAVSRICRYEVARTGLSEKEAAAAGLPRRRRATIKDRTRAGYYPGAGPIWVKLVAHAEQRPPAGRTDRGRGGRGQAHRRARYGDLERDGRRRARDARPRLCAAVLRRLRPAVDRRTPDGQSRWSRRRDALSRRAAMNAAGARRSGVIARLRSWRST